MIQTLNDGNDMVYVSRILKNRGRQVGEES